MPGNIQGIPLSVIAQWPKANHIDPETRSWLIPYAAVLQGVAAILVGARFYLRARNQAGPLGLDDALLAPGFLAGVIFTTLAILATAQYGADRHIWDVSYNKFESLALVAWLSEVTFLVSTTCTKISVLLFFRRLSQGISKAHKVILESVRLQLYAKLSLRGYPSPECNQWRVLCGHRFVRCSSSAVDALNCIFSLGLLVVGAGSARTYYTYLLGAEYDASWIGYNLYVWSDLELQLSIICASAPVMRVFFRKYLSGSMSRMLHTAKSGTNNGSRGSHPLDPEAVTQFAHKHSPSHDSQLDDKLLIKHQVQTGMQPVAEDECSSPSSIAQAEHIIRTPADFEAYALRNLEKNRPPLRSSGSRARNDEKQPSSPVSKWVPASDY
nr:hypothetical protein CFP56_63995 [Quercus suber]